MPLESTPAYSNNCPIPLPPNTPLPGGPMSLTITFGGLSGGTCIAPPAVLTAPQVFQLNYVIATKTYVDLTSESPDLKLLQQKQEAIKQFFAQTLLSLQNGNSGGFGGLSAQLDVLQLPPKEQLLVLERALGMVNPYCVPGCAPEKERVVAFLQEKIEAAESAGASCNPCKVIGKVIQTAVKIVVVAAVVGVSAYGLSCVDWLSVPSRLSTLSYKFISPESFWNLSSFGSAPGSVISLLQRSGIRS